MGTVSRLVISTVLSLLAADIDLAIHRTWRIIQEGYVHAWLHQYYLDW